MKILVIEDEIKIATYIKKGLEMQSMTVDIAIDGQEGLDLALSEKYNVIVLDRMLPKLNGIQVIKKMRVQKNYTPVLMLTAKTQVDDRVEGLQMGADDYLGKPFAFSELIARIKALGRRPERMLPKILQIKDLQLNTNDYSVTRSGHPISLSKKEFTLLEFLMLHPGQVMSASQLTEQVWSYDSDVLPNTAQVYIGYLRKKIDKNFPKLPPLITTVNGFGYKIEHK